MSGSTGQLAPETILDNRYIIVQILGYGGMGAVYKALDQRLNNIPVAIKEMSTKAVGQDNLQAAIGAFKKEASMLISLKHPSLPRISDFFAGSDDRWYLVMDYIDGENLEDVIKKRGAIPETEARCWARQLCVILDYLHTQKPPVIFRDLKPSNIMLTAEGAIKLIDFGIARHFRPGKRSDTTAYGSSGYASPEQYGEFQTDERSDIYALGATLHQLLTGIDPRKGPFSFEPISHIVKVSPGLEQAIMKAVELKPEKRPNSVKEMLFLIDNINRSNETEPLKSKKYATSSSPKIAILIIALIGFLSLAAAGWYAISNNDSNAVVNNEQKYAETQQPEKEEPNVNVTPETAQQQTNQAQPEQSQPPQQPLPQPVQPQPSQQPSPIPATENDVLGYLVIGTCSQNQQAVLNEMEQRNRSGLQTYVIYSSDWSNLAPGWYALIYGNYSDLNTAYSIANNLESNGIDVYVKHSGHRK